MHRGYRYDTPHNQLRLFEMYRFLHYTLRRWLRYDAYGCQSRHRDSLHSRHRRYQIRRRRLALLKLYRKLP